MLNTCRWPNISFTIIVDNCFVENLPQRSLVPEQTMRRRAHVGALWLVITAMGSVMGNEMGNVMDYVIGNVMVSNVN